MSGQDGQNFKLLIFEAEVVVIQYSAALCGAGKTWWACQTMAAAPGRYLYAVDRRDVFADRVLLINQFAAEAGTAPKIVELYSRSQEWPDGVADVRRGVREAGCQYGPHPHVVVVITHEALKSSDLSVYTSGWTCIIDEVPSIWSHGEVKSPASLLYLAAAYNLLPVAGTAWSELQAKVDGPMLTEIHNDTLISGVAELHRHVRDRGVHANLTAWEDTADGRAWSWMAVWSPEKLEPFARVFLLGNAFEHTLTYKLIQDISGAEVKLVPFELPTRCSTTWQPRSLLIRYFAQSHRAGSTFWRMDKAGHECLRRVVKWVNDNTEPSNHYWSCNTFLGDDDTIGIRQIVGRRVPPKIAGENGLRDLTCGTFIYTAKPSDNERHAFEVFNVSADDVVRAREHEDLIQMLWRSSLRDPDDSRPVEFRVYDWWQAEFLREFIEQTAPHVAVSIEQVDLGLDAFQPKPRGRPKSILSQAEQQAKADRAREQARERQRKLRART